VEECTQELRTDLTDGLQSAEATRRLAFTGYNEFELKEKESLWRKYLEQFKNPLIALLLASALVSGIRDANMTIG
jgi:Ca2+-transporting ATPase